MSHAAALAVCVVLTACAQLLLKMGAAGKPTFSASFANRRTVSGYAILGIVTVLVVYALQGLELKVVTAFMSLTYLLVSISAWLFLREELTPNRVLGCLLIMAGIVVFSI